MSEWCQIWLSVSDGNWCKQNAYAPFKILNICILCCILLNAFCLNGNNDSFIIFFYTDFFYIHNIFTLCIWSICINKQKTCLHLCDSINMSFVKTWRYLALCQRVRALRSAFTHTHTVSHTHTHQTPQASCSWKKKKKAVEIYYKK